ncbi:hypothetical protein QFZ22_004288 [Streptomyces canus]|uniref:K1 capsule-specific polysaccharide lyase C-terminal domain-containing protein n=1 Tax=Streptomyces canus TaxID=58343 RepID=A0AAW8FHK3_9ACTN|nr:hypothetical protein [Streptomyces canus]MDQ0908303.1 hypothetical protein [Streptomyces canus]
MAAHHTSRRHLLTTAADRPNLQDPAYGGLGDRHPHVPKRTFTGASSIRPADAETGALTRTPAGATPVSGRAPGTSFGVKGVAGDTSTVAWLIVEPA